MLQDNSKPSGQEKIQFSSSQLLELACRVNGMQRIPEDIVSFLCEVRNLITAVGNFLQAEELKLVSQKRDNEEQRNLNEIYHNFVTLCSSFDLFEADNRWKAIFDESECIGNKRKAIFDECMDTRIRLSMVWREIPSPG